MSQGIFALPVVEKPINFASWRCFQTVPAIIMASWQYKGNDQIMTLFLQPSRFPAVVMVGVMLQLLDKILSLDPATCQSWDVDHINWCSRILSTVFSPNDKTTQNQLLMVSFTWVTWGIGKTVLLAQLGATGDVVNCCWSWWMLQTNVKINGFVWSQNMLKQAVQRWVIHVHSAWWRYQLIQGFLSCINFGNCITVIIRNCHA